MVKAKLNTKRCLPVMGKADGCSVCMKVCPVQRYGLPAVLEEYDRTGTILGKDSDDLEGFDWPLDGQHYGPGNRPRPRATVRSTRRTPLSARSVGLVMRASTSMAAFSAR